MRIKYFAGGNRIKTLEKIYQTKEFCITEIYVANIEPYYNQYESFAKEKNINIVKISKKNLVQNFTLQNEEVLLSVGFRYIIPKEIFSKFKYAINIHPSLLPKYKGAYSGFAIIENAEKETGLTAHFIDEGIDTGDIINQIKIPIYIYDTIDTVTKKLRDIEPNFVVETLLMIKNNNLKITKQPKINNEIIYSKKRKPEDSKIDPTKSLLELLPKIRACSEKYPAYFEIDGVKIKIRLEFEIGVQTYEI